MDPQPSPLDRGRSAAAVGGGSGGGSDGGRGRLRLTSLQRVIMAVAERNRGTKEVAAGYGCDCVVGLAGSPASKCHFEGLKSFVFD